MTVRLMSVLVILLVCASMAQAQTVTPTVTLLSERGIPYVPDGDFKQRLDVLMPDSGAEPYPTILLLHGSGATTSQVTPQRRHFVEQGYAVVSVDYRETQDIGDSLSDAFCALGWVYAHADRYGFDTARLAAFGYSLGGWQAGLLGTVEDGRSFLQADCPHELPPDSRVQAVITYAGALSTPETLVAYGANWSEAQIDYLEYLAQIPPPQWGEFVDAAWQDFLRPLPVYWLDETDPPFLLIHSEDDNMVPAAFSTSFAEAANRAGVRAEVHLLATGRHELLLFNGNRSPEANAVVDAFLASALAPREPAAPLVTATPSS